ncbi:hypothetical protein [Niabella beijingensis]|uniref:hypothetical protein n=1 Tax=Niabella beijingensis TaxID=2872700 RepID=UPI001CC1BDDE|nr:hypothetical protein [Niabella beijingensis]MBZ4190497.1 hypothetical protein [Niabella beijingensis]
MKSYTIIMALFLTSLVAQAANNYPPVNEKVLKTFNRLFTAAQDVQWRYTGDFCEANFQAEGIRLRVALDYNGNLIRTIRYYKKGLPPAILNTVNKKYAHAEIYGITELSDANGIQYDIVLYEKTRMLRLILNANGNVTASHRFKREIM